MYCFDSSVLPQEKRNKYKGVKQSKEKYNLKETQIKNEQLYVIDQHGKKETDGSVVKYCMGWKHPYTKCNLAYDTAGIW